MERCNIHTAILPRKNGRFRAPESDAQPALLAGPCKKCRPVLSPAEGPSRAESSAVTGRGSALGRACADRRSGAIQIAIATCRRHTLRRATAVEIDAAEAGRTIAAVRARAVLLTHREHGFGIDAADLAGHGALRVQRARADARLAEESARAGDLAAEAETETRFVGRARSRDEHAEGR
jgi:hypothetical protein